MQDLARHEMLAHAHDGENSPLDNNEEYLMESQLFSAIEDLQLVVACYFDTSTFDEREPRRYASALTQFAGRAEESQLLGLADIAVRLAEVAERAATKDFEAVSHLRNRLSAFTLAALDYLAEPFSGFAQSSLLACVEPLSKAEVEIIRLMLGAAPSGTEAETTAGDSDSLADGEARPDEVGSEEDPNEWLFNDSEIFRDSEIPENSEVKLSAESHQCTGSDQTGWNQYLVEKRHFDAAQLAGANVQVEKLQHVESKPGEPTPPAEPVYGEPIHFGGPAEYGSPIQYMGSIQYGALIQSLEPNRSVESLSAMETTLSNEPDQRAEPDRNIQTERYRDVVQYDESIQSDDLVASTGLIHFNEPISYLEPIPYVEEIHFAELNQAAEPIQNVEPDQPSQPFQHAELFESAALNEYAEPMQSAETTAHAELQTTSSMEYGEPIPYIGPVQRGEQIQHEPVSYGDSFESVGQIQSPEQSEYAALFEDADTVEHVDSIPSAVQSLCAELLQEIEAIPHIEPVQFTEESQFAESIPDVEPTSFPELIVHGEQSPHIPILYDVSFESAEQIRPEQSEYSALSHHTDVVDHVDPIQFGEPDPYFEPAESSELRGSMEADGYPDPIRQATPQFAEMVGSSEVQNVESAMLQLLVEEFGSVLSIWTDLVTQGIHAASDEERRETAEACAGELEALSRGAEVVGMSALATLLELFKEKTTGLNSRFRWNAVVTQLQEFPLRLVAYLNAPTSLPAASGLIALLQHAGWSSPLDDASAASLSAALANIQITSGTASEQVRAVVAGVEDVSLDLPDDINAELLEGLLSELPMQTGAFALATRRIVEGHGTREDIEVAKRAAHTLKGAANTVGVRGIATLTHHLEDILLALAEHEVFPNLGLSQTLSYAADCLEGMSEALSGMGDPPHDAVSVLQDVLNWANRIDTQGIDVARGDLVQEVTEQEHEEIAAPAQGLERETVPMMRIPAHLIDELLRLVGETMTTAAQIQNRLATSVQQARSISDQNALFQKLVADLENLVDLRGVTLPGKNPAQSAVTGDFDALELEQYNELQTLSRQLSEVATDSREMGLAEEENLAILGELLEQQAQLHHENQHAVMSTRMIPVSTVASRLQRSVRQACRILDKQVELRVHGESTVMDGNLLHELVDPLMHLLRNSVDHGIESEMERTEAGKSPDGHIELLFRREGDYVIVRCQDDGKGLDLNAIRHLAERKGFIEPDLALSDDEVARLILIPGFSTREETTQVSGRGIGMDAVNTKVSAFKGSLTLQSKQGAGLTVEIRLPVTLLSAHALLIRVRNKVVALSTRGIEDIHYAASDLIEHEGEKTLYLLGDKRHEVVELDELLGLPGDRRKTMRLVGRPLLMVRLETGAERAVAVQEVLESRSLVVKTLGPYVPKMTGLVGATILGDGSVAPVVDLPDLLYAPSYIHMPAFIPEPSAGTSDVVGEVGGQGPMRKALVVDDSISARRFAAQIMRDAGYEVRTANDGLDAVSMMERFVPDLVVTDMEMPRMNGFELTRHVRAQDRTRNIPVVMITSRATEKHRHQADLAGVSLYVTKPFNERFLIDQIEALSKSQK